MVDSSLSQTQHRWLWAGVHLTAALLLVLAVSCSKPERQIGPVVPPADRCALHVAVYGLEFATHDKKDILFVDTGLGATDDMRREIQCIRKGLPTLTIRSADRHERTREGGWVVDSKTGERGTYIRFQVQTYSTTTATVVFESSFCDRDYSMKLFYLEKKEGQWTVVKRELKKIG